MPFVRFTATGDASERRFARTRVMGISSGKEGRAKTQEILFILPKSMGYVLDFLVPLLCLFVDFILLWCVHGKSLWCLLEDRCP